MSDFTRLRELAASAALENHDWVFYGSAVMLPPTDKAGHALNFTTCPHPDCQLVREPLAASSPQCDRLIRWLRDCQELLAEPDEVPELETLIASLAGPASSPAPRPDGWLDGEIELTALVLAHPDCDVKAVLRGFADWILAAPKAHP